MGKFGLYFSVYFTGENNGCSSISLLSIRISLVVLVSLVCNSTPGFCDDSKAGTSDKSAALSLFGVKIGDTLQDVQHAVGSYETKLDNGFYLYGNGLMVRIKEGKVVNLGASGLRWALQRGKRILINYGDNLTSLYTVLGKPQIKFRVPRNPVLHIELYREDGSDLAVLVQSEQIVGCLMSEPGMMEMTLREKGYKQIR